MKTLIAAATLWMLAATPSEAAPSQSLPPEGELPISLAGQAYDLATRIFRPAGAGPFPLVVINHGTPPDKSKLAATKLSFARAARWFVAQGYMVVVALRPGFGSSTGRYLEAAGNCRTEDFVAAGRRTAAIEAAIVTAASALPGTDPHRIVVVGQSAGGYGAVALADAPPLGVVGVISFAGGRGSNGKGTICAGEDRLIAAEKTFGAANRVPQLWLYAANDHFFRPDLARRMVAASTPPVAFVDLPPFGDDGHKTLAQADPSVWAAPVFGFLARVEGR